MKEHMVETLKVNKEERTHFDVSDDALMQKNVDLDWLAIHFPEM